MRNIDEVLKIKLNREMDEIKVPSSLFSFANEVPGIVQQNITDQSIIKQNKWKKKMITLGVVAASTAFILCSTVFSSTLADYVERLPFLKMEHTEEFLANFGSLVDAAKNDQFSELGVKAEDNGIKMIITDVMYDGKIIAISFSLETNEKINETDLSHEHKIKFDEKKANWSSVQDFSKINENKYTGIMEIFVPNEKIGAEKMTTQLSFDKVLGKTGDWDYQFEVVKMTKK